MKIERDFLESVAREAGDYALSHQGKAEPEKKTVSVHIGDDYYREQKSSFSFVDLTCQKMIMKAIGSTYKGLGLVAEENDKEIEVMRSQLFVGENELVEGRYTLMIDPIDGTSNYLSATPGTPYKISRKNNWGVSICILHGTDTIGGAIYYPAVKLMLSTIKGEGTQINGKLLRINSNKEFDEQEYVRIGGIDKTLHRLREYFPSDIDKSPGSWVSGFLALLKGSQANLEIISDLDLVSYTSYVGKNVNMFDIGCGILAYQEAGGIVVNAEGNEFNPFADTVYDEGEKSLKARSLMIMAPGKIYVNGLLKHLESNNVSFLNHA